MNFVSTKKSYEFLTITIVLVLIVGAIGGYVVGESLKGPTPAALEAMEDIVKYPYLAEEEENSDWHETAQEIGWTTTSYVCMFGIWTISIVISVFLNAKQTQLEMLDAVVNNLEKIEEKLNKECYDDEN